MEAFQEFCMMMGMQFQNLAKKGWSLFMICVIAINRDHSFSKLGVMFVASWTHIWLCNFEGLSYLFVKEEWSLCLFASEDLLSHGVQPCFIRGGTQWWEFDKIFFVALSDWINFGTLAFWIKEELFVGILLYLVYVKVALHWPGPGLLLGLNISGKPSRLLIDEHLADSFTLLILSS